MILTKSDSKLYINFEFYRGKNFKNKLIYKAKKNLLTQKHFKKSLHILEDGANNALVNILNA